MPIKFYDSLIAYYPARARIALLEKGLKYEPVYVNISNGESLKPWYMRINPNSTCPVLIDEEKDVKLLHSTEIARYVDNYDGKPLGGDKVDRKLVEEWIDSTGEFDGNIFMGAYAPESTKSVLKQVNEFKIKYAEARAKENPDLKEAYEEKIKIMKVPRSEGAERHTEILVNLVKKAEEQLAKTPFLAGSEYSLADAEFTVVLARVMQAGVVEKFIKPYPAVSEYLERVQKRASWDKCFSTQLSKTATVKAMLPALLYIKFATATGWY